MRYLPIPVAKKPQIRYITTPVFITYDARTSPAKLPPPSIAATYPQAEGRLSIARNGRPIRNRTFITAHLTHVGTAARIFFKRYSMPSITQINAAHSIVCLP